MNNPSSEETLRKELGALGAREFEIVALMMDPERGLAALHYASTKGVDRPIPYAIKVFDSDWEPSRASRKLVTNASVEVTCAHCGGDRFVLVTDGPRLWEETYAPCKVCNAQANTLRWVYRERRETAPR